MDCCGSLFRFLLAIINILFLLIGIALVVTTSLLKWSNISRLKEIQGLDTALNVTSIDAVTIALLCIGGFIVFLSFIGLIGACCSNRCFLVIYQIITLILFIAHTITLIGLLLITPKIEQQYRIMFNTTINDINASPSNQTNFNTSCTIMFAISSLFQCCGGVNGAKDIISPMNREKCCMNVTLERGCVDVTLDWFKINSKNYLIIPTSVIILFELIAIASVQFMIRSMRKNRSIIQSYHNNEAFVFNRDGYPIYEDARRNEFF